MRKLIHGQSIFRVLTAFLLCFTTMLALSSPVRANAKGASPLAELPVTNGSAHRAVSGYHGEKSNQLFVLGASRYDFSPQHNR